MKGPSAASRARAERNLGIAASRGPGSGRAEAILTSTVTTPVNDAVLAERAAQKALEDRAAGRVLARLLMTAEGCRGPGCRRSHQAHLEHGRHALMILGLMADPETVRRPPKGFGHPKAAAG